MAALTRRRSTPSPRSPASRARPSPTRCTTPTGWLPPPASGCSRRSARPATGPRCRPASCATRRAHAIAVRAERQQDGISGLVLDTFFHGLAEAGHRSGLRVVLYAQPEDEAAELALVDDLLHTGRPMRWCSPRPAPTTRARTHLARAGAHVLRLRPALGPRPRSP